MTFREEVINHFTDEEGLVTIDRDPRRWSTGNGLLHLGIFCTLLHRMREARASDVIRFSSAVDRCWEGSSPPLVGLLERNDGRPDWQAHDDYVGVVAASFHFHTYHAPAIASYGARHYWCFDNERPESPRLTKIFSKAFHGRFPGRIGFYRKAAGRPSGLFQKIQLAGAIAANAITDPSQVDAKLMTWLVTTVMEKECPLVDDAIEFWKSRARRDYGNFGNMCKPYFKEGHPFSRLTMQF